MYAMVTFKLSCTGSKVITCMHTDESLGMMLLYFVIVGPKPNRPTEQQLDDDVAQDIHGLDNSTKLLRLAVQLGVAYSRAVEILERSEDWYRQLMDVFSEWRKTASDYTWEALIMALRRVDEGPLADELYNKYILH